HSSCLWPLQHAAYARFVSQRHHSYQSIIVLGPPPALAAISAFYGIGALIAATTSIALLSPGGFLEPIWRLNPTSHTVFQHMGPLAIVLMILVAIACGLAAVGLWIQARWGHRLALLLLGVNLVGDALNAFARGDPRTLIGLPFAGLLILYL